MSSSSFESLNLDEFSLENPVNCSAGRRSRLVYLSRDSSHFAEGNLILLISRRWLTMFFQLKIFSIRDGDMARKPGHIYKEFSRSSGPTAALSHIYSTGADKRLKRKWCALTIAAS